MSTKVGTVTIRPNPYASGRSAGTRTKPSNAERLNKKLQTLLEDSANAQSSGDIKYHHVSKVAKSGEINIAAASGGLGGSLFRSRDKDKVIYLPEYEIYGTIDYVNELLRTVGMDPLTRQTFKLGQATLKQSDITQNLGSLGDKFTQEVMEEYLRQNGFERKAKGQWDPVPEPFFIESSYRLYKDEDLNKVEKSLIELLVASKDEEVDAKMFYAILLADAAIELEKRSRAPKSQESLINAASKRVLHAKKIAENGYGAQRKGDLLFNIAGYLLDKSPGFTAFKEEEEDRLDNIRGPFLLPKKGDLNALAKSYLNRLLDDIQLVNASGTEDKGKGFFTGKELAGLKEQFASVTNKQGGEILARRVGERVEKTAKELFGEEEAEKSLKRGAARTRAAPPPLGEQGGSKPSSPISPKPRTSRSPSRERQAKKVSGNTSTGSPAVEGEEPAGKLNEEFQTD